jgi:hypothetical protein
MQIISCCTGSFHQLQNECKRDSSEDAKIKYFDSADKKDAFFLQSWGITILNEHSTKLVLVFIVSSLNAMMSFVGYRLGTNEVGWELMRA